MISFDEVRNILKSLGDLSDEELDTYSMVINNCVYTVSSHIKSETENDERISYLAAAKANYEIALARSGSDRVTTFKAGDVSISESDSFIEYAKELFESAKHDCSDLISDEGFAFLGV